MPKKKTLLFIDGPVTAEQKKQAHLQGAVIRNPRAYKPGDFIEQADAVAGAAPKAYLDAYPRVNIDGEGLAQETSDQPQDKKPSVADIRAALTERGIEFDPGAKKADLQALLDAAGNPAGGQGNE